MTKDRKQPTGNRAHHLCSLSSLFFLSFVLCPLSSAFADAALDALVAAYPDFLAGYDAQDLIWKDGTRMAISDGIANKSFDELLNRPDIKDQFAIPYPLGSPLKVPAVNEDPGRIRYEPLFLKMYGDCRKGEVQKRLKPVAWMPQRRGGTVSVTTVNGVNERLADVVGRTRTASRRHDAIPGAGGGHLQLPSDRRHRSAVSACISAPRSTSTPS